jgi:prepilin-type N-terminal cleavage/methylation domain-containing protein
MIQLNAARYLKTTGFTPGIRRKSRGFTLIEILIVVVILGILAAIIVPQFTNATDQAEKTAAHSQLNVLRGQVTLYFAKHGTVSPLGEDINSVVGVLTDEGLLSSTPLDLDANPNNGFQVHAGYTLVWDPEIWALEAISSDGNSSGW